MQYILFRNTPFTPNQDAALAAVAKSAGYEPIVLRGAEPAVDFPWNECVAALGLISKDYIDRMPNLRWVQMSWVGIDALRGANFHRADCVLTNASGGYGATIAEYMVGGALMLLHNFHEYARIQPRKEWNRVGVTRTLYGATVVAIGLGDIGGRFARYAKALGANVLGVRRSASGALPEGVDEIVPFDQLLSKLPDADVVAMCIPATAESSGLFSAAHVAAMKPGAIFVNCGRGSTVDEPALIRALQAKAIGGAMLDVTQTEPLPRDNPLWDLDNVVVTPHVAGRMDDPTNAAMIYRLFVDNLNRFIRGEELLHIADRKRGY